jgi:hypothetical protein
LTETPDGGRPPGRDRIWTGAAPGEQERHQEDAGPDLTGRGFASEWLATKLAEPERNRVRADAWVVMPDLDVTDAEIAAPVAYLNGGGLATTR